MGLGGMVARCSHRSIEKNEERQRCVATMRGNDAWLESGKRAGPKIFYLTSKAGKSGEGEVAEEAGGA